MNRIVDLAEHLPKPIRDIGRDAFIYASKATNKNELNYTEQNTIFKYRFIDEYSLRKFSACIENGRISHEQVDIDILNVDNRHDAIIDIGSHIGIYSVILSQLNPNLPIYCFEPDHYNRRVLREQLRVNNVLDRVTVLSEIVSGKSGTISWYADPEGTVAHTAHPTNDHRDFQRVERESIALSDFSQTKGIQYPWVKIDAEGSEFEILQDLFDTDIFDGVEGFVELHTNREGNTLDRLSDVMNEYGYRYEIVKDTKHNPGYSFSPIDWE